MRTHTHHPGIGKLQCLKTEMDPMNTFRSHKTQFKLLRTLAGCFVALGLAMVLTGCGTGLSSSADSLGTSRAAVNVSGLVHGGQQPVTGATIQLYTVGITGLKSAATPLIGRPCRRIAVATSPSLDCITASVQRRSILYLASLNDGTLQGPVGVAVNGTGRVLATGFTTGTSVGGALSQFTSGGAAVAGSPATSGITSPSGVAADGTSIWVANSAASGALAQFSYGSTTPVSPVAGFGSLSSPVGVAVDASGSMWTANSGSNTVSKFIGLAGPTATPLSAIAGP